MDNLNKVLIQSFLCFNSNNFKEVNTFFQKKSFFRISKIFWSLTELDQKIAKVERSQRPTFEQATARAGFVKFYLSPNIILEFHQNHTWNLYPILEDFIILIITQKSKAFDLCNILYKLTQAETRFSHTNRITAPPVVKAARKWRRMTLRTRQEKLKVFIMLENFINN